MFNNKKVLITGGAGFIGSNLALRLVQEKAQVCVVDAMIPDLGGNYFNLEPVKNQIRFEQSDLRDANLANMLVRDFDYIFNLVGNVSHLDSMYYPSLDMSINVNAQLNVLEACRFHNKNAVIIYTSTRQIYGVPQSIPVSERHPIQPVDVNGINKYAAEQYHTLYAKVYGLKTVSLRLTNTYGPRQLIRHARQGFIGWFINRAITANKIQLYGGGDQNRDLCYVSDVVNALCQVAVEPKCYGEVYNLGGHKTSLKAVAQELIKLAGQGSIESIEFPSEKKKIDIGDYIADYSKLKQITGWQPQVDLNQGLKTMVEYYLKNSNHYLN